MKVLIRLAEAALGVFLLLNGRVVCHFGFVELRLHGGQRSQGRVGLCLLFGSRDAERGGRAKEKGSGKQGAAAHECSSAECDGMLVQYGSSSIEHVARSKQAD